MAQIMQPVTRQASLAATGMSRLQAYQQCTTGGWEQQSAGGMAEPAASQVAPAQQQQLLQLQGPSVALQGSNELRSRIAAIMAQVDEQEQQHDREYEGLLIHQRMQVSRTQRPSSV